MITLIVILIAIPVILIIALFSRKGINTKCVIEINKPQQQVFDYLVLMKNQEQYNAWLMTDPQSKKTYIGTDGQPGFNLAWDSKNKKIGKASQRITEVTSPQKIGVELVFEKPVPSTAHHWFELSPVNASTTRITWRYEGNTAPYYLLRVTHLLFNLKKRVTKYMETSLGNLKANLEK